MDLRSICFMCIRCSFLSFRSNFSLFACGQYKRALVDYELLISILEKFLLIIFHFALHMKLACICGNKTSTKHCLLVWERNGSSKLFDKLGFFFYLNRIIDVIMLSVVDVAIIDYFTCVNLRQLPASNPSETCHTKHSTPHDKQTANWPSIGDLTQLIRSCQQISTQQSVT